MSSRKPPSTVVGLKKLAKSLKAALGIAHHEALDAASQRMGFNNFRDAQKRLSAQDSPVEPAVHNGFTDLAEEPVMRVSAAVEAGLIPPPPVVTSEDIARVADRAVARDAVLQPVDLSKNVYVKGEHLSFVRTGRIHHALEDYLFPDGSAWRTVQHEGAVYQLVEEDEEVQDSHAFLAQVYRDGKWHLETPGHLLAESAGHIGMTYAQLANS